MTVCLANLCIRIAPVQIYFLKFILEAYDNLAILSTVDKIEGLVELKYPPELEMEVKQLLQSMALRLGLEDLNT